MSKKEKVLRTFRLRKGVGPHFERNPEFDPNEPESEDNPRDLEIAVGQKFKSHRPLDQLFVNKFDNLSHGEDRSMLKVAGGDVHENPDDDPDLDRPVTSYEDALVRRPNRHRTDDEIGNKPHLKKLNKGRKSQAADVASKMGDDVTEDFEGAREADFRVFKKGSKFSIADADEPTKALKKGLKQGKVKAAIEQLSNAED